jgi:hypothetical protein
MDNANSMLVPVDPTSERTLTPLSDLIAEELLAQIQVGRSLASRDDIDLIGTVIADAVLDRFLVRERYARRYFRLDPSAAHGR